MSEVFTCRSKLQYDRQKDKCRMNKEKEGGSNGLDIKMDKETTD